MRRLLVGVMSVAIAGSWCAGRAEAFTSKTKATPISVTASGVTATQTLTVQIVDEGVLPDTISTLDFGTGANDFRNSSESLKVDVTTNLAANRIIIYTDNLNATASPKYCADTGLGNDGGGLVGTPDCSTSVPMLWGVSATNAVYPFGSTVGDNEVFITDLAHVATFVDGVLGAGAAAAEKQKLDTLVMRECISGAAVANVDNAGTGADPERYPQFFGIAGGDKDLCYSGASVPVSITSASGGVTTISATCNGLAAPCPAASKVPFSEELSKNIAVVGFGFLNKTGNVPNLSTPSPSDSLSVTAPFYLPIAADFRTASGQNYGTSTLTLELVTQ